MPNVHLSRKTAEKYVSHRAISEHRRLESLLSELADAFEAGQVVDALLPVFDQLANELDIHFEREDGLYFPAIIAIRPDMKSAFEGASRRHVWFREQLRLIGDHLRHQDAEGAAHIFGVLHESFRAHERLEEALLAKLEVEVAG